MFEIIYIVIAPWEVKVVIEVCIPHVLLIKSIKKKT
jgi:hypothetical protein